MNPKQSRGKCSVCGRDVAVTKAGLAYRHSAPHSTKLCRGSKKQP